jgi:hypothetical protein
MPLLSNTVVAWRVAAGLAVAAVVPSPSTAADPTLAVSANGVGRWKHFEAQLAPLIEALGEGERHGRMDG